MTSEQRLTEFSVLRIVAGIGVLVLGAVLLQLYRERVRATLKVTHISRVTNDGIHKEQLAPLLLVNGRVLFTEIQNNRNVLASVDGGGGEVTRQAGPRDNATLLSASADTLFFGSLWENSEPKFSVRTASAELPRPLTADLSAHGASWSQTQQMLAFTRGHEVLLADRTGGARRVLVHMEGIPFWPRWSPSGNSIRFSVREGANEPGGIYEISSAGGTPQIVQGISEPKTSACCGEWTPDGRYFVFVRGGPQSGALWVRSEWRWSVSVPEPRPLSEGSVDFWRSPVISADGKQLFALGETLRGELLRYDRSKGYFQRFLEGVSGDTPNFSRDGASLAYTQFPEGTLWRSKADGTVRVQLTEAGEVARFPRWSPDGRQIAYIASRDHQTWQVFVIAATGGPARHVFPSTVSQGVATWSPDSRKVAFGTISSFAQSSQGSAQISIFDLESGKLETLSGSEGMWAARWSPDGRYLAATTLDRNRLMLYDFAKRTWSTAAEIGVNDMAWSADGQSLYIDATNGRKPEISILDVRSRSLKPYVDLSGIKRTGFDGWSFSLAPNDEPILLQQSGIQEVYRLDLSTAAHVD